MRLRALFPVILRFRSSLSKRLHILFISSWYPSRQNPTHGIFNRYFAEAASAHCDVSVLHMVSVADAAKRFETEVKDENSVFTVTVYYRKITSAVPLLSQLQKLIRVKKAAMRGYKTILSRKGAPQLVQLNVIIPHGPAAMSVAKRAGAPLVISENWSGYTKEDGNYRGVFLKWFTRRIVRFSSMIMPTSSYLKDAMLSRGLAGNYRVVPNVVNTSLFRIMSRRCENKIRFIHVSSLNDREKNVSGIIRAFSRALEKDPDLELMIVGKGIDEDKYRSMVRTLRLESEIRFAGLLDRERLVSEINASECLVMFSNYETFCLVIPEAFACGRPVITSRAGAIPTYMRDDLGLQVPVGDEEALTSAIVSFREARKHFDADKIRAYAVEHFSYETVGSVLYDIYKSVSGSTR